MDCFGCRRYPPSILLISDHRPGAAELQRNLEDHGCRVEQIGAERETLLEVGQTFFDAIVLPIERFDQNIGQLCGKLASNRELAPIPVIVLVKYGVDHGAGADLDLYPPIHYLAWEAGVEARLLQIIEEIHYLTDRYA
jgi:PleD family two-component response regulator